MAQVRIGLTCEAGHFNEIGLLWEPVKDKDIDKLAERARVPVECERVAGRSLANCGHPFVGLPHVEGRDREAQTLARHGGRNVRAPLESSSKKRPKEGPLKPAEWKRQVFDAQRPHPGAAALCAVTGEPLSFTYDDAHHPLEKRLLRARGLHHLVWDPRNGMAVKREIHEGQTSGTARIPRDKVPEHAWAFAREIGPWAVARVEADHPQAPNNQRTKEK